MKLCELTPAEILFVSCYHPAMAQVSLYDIAEEFYAHGGKSKDRKQIAGLTNAYIAADGLEIGDGKKIPLWLFGFLK